MDDANDPDVGVPVRRPGANGTSDSTAHGDSLVERPQSRTNTSNSALTPAQREALAGGGVDVTEQKEQSATSAAGAVRADRWTLTLAAAAAFREREGHLTVPRKYVETVEHDGEAHQVKLGVALANARQRRATFPPDRLDALTALDMRWT